MTARPAGNRDPQHTYAARGPTRHVDGDRQRGDTGSITQPVTRVGSPPPNVPPQASFSYTADLYTASFTGVGTDSDGQIASYAWDFDDSSTGTGATPVHPYATGGTYDVTLTVTDNDGDTGSVTQPVTVSDPPPNAPPEASFSYTTQFRTASFTGVGTDTDGQIASYAWDFGDSSTGTGRIRCIRTRPAASMT